MNPLENLGKLIAKLWAPIAGILGAITAIVQFIQLWRGDQETVTQVLWIGGIVLIWISLYRIGFSTSESSIRTSDVWGHEKTKQVYSYGEKLSKAGRTFFFLSIVGILVLWGFSIRRNNLLNDKVVVLIADFDGTDPKNYRVTEELLSQLTNSLSEYDDTVIISLGKVITEQEGSSKAQELGKNYRADLVIWGWYGVTESDVLLTVHIENLSALEYIPLSPSNLYGIQLPALEIKSFQIQQHLSSQMTALTLFVGGLTRYEAGDYQNAIERFGKILNEEWPDSLIPKTFVFYYRGSSYYELLYETSDLSNCDRAIADFSEAIKMDPDFFHAYYYRAVCYSVTRDIQKAREDYRIVVDKAPEGLFSYSDLGSLSFGILEDNAKAIKYFTLAIESDPKDTLALYDRAMAYLAENKNEASLTDINQAIRVEPKIWLYYYGRAGVYKSTGNYGLALNDLNKALDLYPRREDQKMTSLIYHSRGQAYASIEEYSKALEDFSRAIELAPWVSIFHFSRGITYLQLEEYENAIPDFSFYIKDGEEKGFDRTTPEAYFYRGVALEKLGYPGNALLDYGEAARLYSLFVDALKKDGDVSGAMEMCKSAIILFQNHLEESQDLTVIPWVSGLVKMFQDYCPTITSPSSGS